MSILSMSGGTTTLAAIAAALPAHYERDAIWAQKGTDAAAKRYTLLSPAYMTVNIDDSGYVLSAQQELDLSAEATWDAVTTDYRVAATRAGKDFYVYACVPASGIVPVLKVSANSTVPAGYLSTTSRKVVGFHCLCVAAGTIASHSLTDFAAGDILPGSIWDLKHRPSCNSEGMAYSSLANLWVDIYLPSGTGANTASVNGATISDTRTWMQFVDDLGAVGKRLLSDPEFQIVAEGCNQKTNITGSADPVTTTGHTDTAGRRMLSNIGLEDCAGALWQWLSDQSYRYDNDSGTAFAWETLADNKGSLYRQNSFGDVKLMAGGGWGDGTICGSRSRHAGCRRAHLGSGIGARGCARSRST